MTGKTHQKTFVSKFSAEYTETSSRVDNFAAVILSCFFYTIPQCNFKGDQFFWTIPVVSIASGCHFSVKEGISNFTPKRHWSTTKLHGTPSNKTTILKEKALASIYRLHLNLTERTTTLKGNALLSTYQTVRWPHTNGHSFKWNSDFSNINHVASTFINNA